jgi:flagella basal body P-ring formation protein FlgA
MSDLEVVPLVTRGQLVDVISQVGPIEARTVGRATGSGTLGDVIELRIGGRRGKTLTGVVTGQRRVVVSGGMTSSDTGEVQLAFGAER